MLRVHKQNFDNLDSEQTAYLAKAIGDKNPEFKMNGSLLKACNNIGLDQAGVILSVSNDPSSMAVQCMEVLMDKPITRLKARVKRPAGSVSKKLKPRSRAPQIDPRIIKSVVQNPKRQGSASYDRYEFYEVGLTVTQALERGLTNGDIKHDLGKGFITVV